MVPSETSFSNALNAPLDVVQSLFAEHQASSSNGNSSSTSPSFEHIVASYFRDIFGSRERCQKIPSLSPASLAGLSGAAAGASGKLVRWRCMLQDTGLGTEVFLGSTPPTEQGRPRQCGMFGAEVRASGADSESADLSQDRPLAHGDYANLRERTVFYAVSVPGETAWARAAHGHDSRADADDDVASALAQMNINASTSATATSTSSAGTCTNPYSSKHPLPGEYNVGGLIKIYDVDVAEKLKTTDVVEVVGILDQASLPNADWQDSGAPSATAGTSTAVSESGGNAEQQIPQVPCVHAIFLDVVPASAIPPDLVDETRPSSTSVETQTRQGLVDYLAGALGGDQLAAEFALLAVMARIHTQRAALSLGSLSLNLSGFPSPPSGSSRLLPLLTPLLATLLPAVVPQSLALPHLNDSSTSLFPRSTGESLNAGRLQLPRGTCVVVDEGSMGEGQLGDQGVRNIRALSSVLQNHKLGYAFPFSEFEFDTDLNFIILSQGKSFLPVDVHVPLRTSASANTDPSKIYASDAASIQVQGTTSFDAAQLRAWRLLILQNKYKDFAIPETTSDHIQNEFVNMRKEARGPKEDTIGQEDLLRRMGIARLLALSHGKTELDIATWSRAVEMDEARRARIKEDADSTAASARVR